MPLLKQGQSKWNEVLRKVPPCLTIFALKLMKRKRERENDFVILAQVHNYNQVQTRKKSNIKKHNFDFIFSQTLTLQHYRPLVLTAQNLRFEMRK